MVQYTCIFALDNSFVFLSDSILPKDRTPNVAFFSILIQKIVESDTLHLPHELPRFVQKLGLCVPDKLSSVVILIKLL